MSEGPARRRRMIEGSQTSLHVHLVWGMHGRRPLLVSHLDQKLFRFMHLKLTQIGCRPRAIGAPTTTFTSLSRSVRRSPSLVWSQTSKVPHPSSRIANWVLAAGSAGRLAAARLRWRPTNCWPSAATSCTSVRTTRPVPRSRIWNARALGVAPSASAGEPPQEGFCLT